MLFQARMLSPAFSTSPVLDLVEIIAHMGFCAVAARPPLVDLLANAGSMKNLRRRV